jgi:hypothetical protein
MGEDGGGWGGGWEEVPESYHGEDVYASLQTLQSAHNWWIYDGLIYTLIYIFTHICRGFIDGKCSLLLNRNSAFSNQTNLKLHSVVRMGSFPEMNQTIRYLLECIYCTLFIYIFRDWQLNLIVSLMSCMLGTWTWQWMPRIIRGPKKSIVKFKPVVGWGPLF